MWLYMVLYMWFLILCYVDFIIICFIIVLCGLLHCVVWYSWLGIGLFYTFVLYTLIAYGYMCTLFEYICTLFAYTLVKYTLFE